MKKRKNERHGARRSRREAAATEGGRLLRGRWEPIGVAASRAVVEPQDKMVLEIRWAGGEGRLQGLVDNGRTVQFDPMPSGPAGLRALWDAPEAGSHFLQFAVVFQGTRTGLVATATLDGRGGFDAPVEKKTADFIWLANGDVVPEGGQ